MSDEDIYYEPSQSPEVAYDTGVNVTQDDIAEQSADGESSFERRLIAVQRKLKAPKSQFNSYGGYAYRSCEDILEALKPLLEEYDLLLTIDDDIYFCEGRFYVKATVTVSDVMTGSSRSAHGFAREPENRKGADQSQVTGSCSSYARKYALNALFLIDDTKDVDEQAGKPQQKQRVKQPPAHGPFTVQCTSCGTRYTFDNIDQYNYYAQNPVCCAAPNWVVE